MEKVIIFGTQDFAELAWFYLENDSIYKVVAFTVDRAYLPDENTFHGLPVVAFEDIEKKYSPDEYQMFAPMSPKNMNLVRAEVYNKIKKKGFKLISYVSSRATLFNNEIGENCFILEDNTIQPFTKIGNNVVLWSGNHIGHHGVIEDHVSFTSHVVLSGHCRVKAYSFFGVNATIRDGLTISEGTLIGMGANIVKDTQAWSVYVGQPAKLLEGKNSKNIL